VKDQASLELPTQKEAHPKPVLVSDVDLQIASSSQTGTWPSGSAVMEGDDVREVNGNGWLYPIRWASAVWPEETTDPKYKTVLMFLKDLQIGNDHATEPSTRDLIETFIDHLERLDIVDLGLTFEANGQTAIVTAITDHESDPRPSWEFARFSSTTRAMSITELVLQLDLALGPDLEETEEDPAEEDTTMPAGIHPG
jgi:hypothetical protein